MKKMILNLSAVAAIATTGLQAGGDIAPVVTPQVSESYFYGGVGIDYNNVYADRLKWFDITASQDKLIDLEGILGYNYNRYIAVEGRIYKTILQKDYADAFGVSFFLKPQYQFIDEENPRDNYFSVYGLLGFGYSQVKGTDGRTPGDPSIIGKKIVDDWGFQWGAGVSYTFTDEYSSDGSGDWSVFVEYHNNFHKKSIKPTKLYANDPKVYNWLSSDNLMIGILYRF